MASDRVAQGFVEARRRGTEHKLIHVTDHALVRFLERTGAFDLEQIRSLIAHSLERSRKAAERAGVADFKVVVDGLCYVVERGNLVTVNEDDRNRRRWGR